jgi:hypothetical protein
MLSDKERDYVHKIIEMVAAFTEYISFNIDIPKGMEVDEKTRYINDRYDYLLDEFIFGKRYTSKFRAASIYRKYNSLLDISSKNDDTDFNFTSEDYENIDKAYKYYRKYLRTVINSTDELMLDVDNMLSSATLLYMKARKKHKLVKCRYGD